MSVLISGYYSSADPRKLDKSGNLQTIFGGIEAKLKDDCDLMNPTFVLYTNNDYVRINYLYCSTWGKYYFVNDISFSAGRTMELHCGVDVLMTYREAISNLDVNVVRQEYMTEPYLPDAKYKLLSGMDTIIDLFESSPFYYQREPGSEPGYCFCLTLNGNAGAIWRTFSTQPGDWDLAWGDYYAAGEYVEGGTYKWYTPEEYPYGAYTDFGLWVVSLTTLYPYAAPPWNEFVAKHGVAYKED